MSSYSLWWPMCSTSVFFSSSIFSLGLVNSPFHSSVFLLMRSSTAMDSSGLSTLPFLSPILTSNSSNAPSPTATIAVVFSYMTSTSSLPLLVLPSAVASPSPSIWVLSQKLSPSRRAPEPYCPVPPVSSLP